MRIYLGVVMFVAIMVCSPTRATEEANEGVKQATHVAESPLHLDEQTQQLAGIKLITLIQARHTDEIIAYGRALSIHAMLALHQRYLMNNSEQHRLAAQLAQATQALKRTHVLYQEGAIALRGRQQQHAQWQSDKAQYEQALIAHAALVAEAKISWGDTISRWLLAEQTPQLAQLIASETCLLQINIATNAQYTEMYPHIQVSAVGKRDHTHGADFISNAPQVEAAQQGSNYFYLTQGSAIKPGMNITAWLPLSTRIKTGVVVPKSALIWYLGQSFVYLKTSNETFTRQRINDYSVVADGLFIEHSALQPGVQVVITGAQLLLSEEMRAQIPIEENED